MNNYEHAMSYYYNWLKGDSKSNDHALQVISLYESVLKDMSNYLVESVAKFDVFLIIISIVLSVQVLN